MLHHNSSPVAELRDRLLASFERDGARAETLAVSRQAMIYRAGDPGQMVYFIESGRVKLESVSRVGKACMLSIHGAGDIFGELALTGAARRVETATAMDDSQLRRMARTDFLARLRQEGLLELFIRYLAAQVAEQHQRIATFVTMDSEQRLGRTLLMLAPEVRISHEDLASLVGTTRPRVTTFLRKFRHLDLITVGEQKRLLVHEHQLAAWLTART